MTWAPSNQESISFTRFHFLQLQPEKYTGASQAHFFLPHQTVCYYAIPSLCFCLCFVAKHFRSWNALCNNTRTELLPKGSVSSLSYALAVWFL
ncbi:hypothetical protein OPV22_003184 [Ensete ventricosum]|uniref:Uncharacterized protein n=1 Tax=Ensete ventricosum TaxID=4639 RepID=A0AAV8S045_ENSVE|nr:hypothetical protein OPV22_003184 [Ensete ventricosum]